MKTPFPPTEKVVCERGSRSCQIGRLEVNTHLAIRTGANVLVPDLGETVKARPKPNSVCFEYFSGGLKGWLC